MTGFDDLGDRAGTILTWCSVRTLGEVAACARAARGGHGAPLWADLCDRLWADKSSPRASRRAARDRAEARVPKSLAAQRARA